MKKNQLFSFRGIVSLLITLLAAAALTSGCGGGGGSSSAPVEDIGPIVSIIEGYVYVPSSGTAAPLNASQKAVENPPVLKNQPSQTDTNKVTPPAAKPSPDLKSSASAKETSEASVKSSSAAVSRASIIPTSGYVPLTGATVQLGGTNKATVTNPTGYYRFEIGQKEIMAFGTKKLMINKPEANVSIEFEVAIVSGDSRYIHTEINTKTGEKTVKEVLTNRVQSPFIFVSGRATGATGVALAGAAITAVKVSNTSFTKTAYADSYGRYSFSELTDGLYTLTVVKENYKTTSKNVEVSSTYTLSNIDFIIPGTFSVSPRAVTPELSSVKIVYATSVPTSYTIEYGLSSTYLYSSTSNLYNLTNEITLTNLSPKTVYHYKIKAVDQYGNTINTDDATFETLDPNTNSKEAPIVNSNYTVRKTHNSITVTFNTNMSSYAQIEYAVSSASVYARYPADGSEIGPQSNFELTVPNLTNSTTYKFFIVTKNIANKSVFRREPQQLPVQVTTDNSPDITPPVISGVTVTDLKAKEAVINFSSIDIHENIRNNTDAKIYYGLASYPVLQYDFSVIPPRVRLDYYQKISETLPFNFDSQKVIKLTGLEPSKKYYFRPASNDPSGNIGTVTDEISFTTAAPGTALTFALSESPAAGQISVGEHAKIFRLIAKGSTEENLIIKKMVFKQTGSIPYNAIEKLTVTDGVNTWTVTNPVSSNIEVKFDSIALSIPKNNSIYLTINMTLNTSALNPGGSPRDVKLKLDANTATETNVEVVGDIYDTFIKDQVKGLALESSAQTINIGQLVLSPPLDAQNSTETRLVNRGQKDITLFKFKLESRYEDINITKIQLSQIGSAIAETDYSNIRLYDGISSLAVGASSGSDILFQSITGLVKISKGDTNTKTLSIVADIQQGATDARYLMMQIDKINLSGSGTYSQQNVEVLGVGTPVTGAKFTIGDSELLASRTTDSPTKQTFKIGDTNKTFTIIQLNAGSAEDVRIDTMELMFQGTASFTSSAFSIIDENNTVIYTKSVGGGGISAETGYNAATKKFTVVPQSSLIVPKGSFKKIYIKGNISSTAFEVGKTIQINIANDGDIKGTGVQTNSAKAAVGTAIGSEHSIIGGIAMTAVLPQPSNILLPGSKYDVGNNGVPPDNNTFLKFKITPNGEAVDVQSFNFSFSGSYTILDNLKVIEYKADNTTVEVAINPLISGSTITLVPQNAVNITTAGKTFHLIGDILNTATSNDTVRFNIVQDGIVVSGVSSKQIYKTQELINGNTLGVSTEAFYLLQASASPEKMIIGDAAAQEVFSFKLEAKPRSGYYLQKITLRQLGTGTFGAGQDISTGDFEFYSGAAKVAGAIITVSGSNLTIEFPNKSDASVDATSSATTSQFLTCKLMAKSQQTAINDKTLKFYIDNTLVTIKSITSNNQITGTGSVTGTTVTLKEGLLTAKTRSDNPAAANISTSGTSTAVPFLTFDLTSEVEALDVKSILVTLDVKNGLITDFVPSSMKISVGGVAYPNSTVTSSGNKFTITPLNNDATPKYLQVPANNSVKIAISGDINYAGAQNGSQISLRIAENSDIIATGATSKHTIYSSGIINGNYMTVQKSASSLTVTAVASPPPVAPATAILTNTTAADLFAFNLKADVSENIKLTKLNITYDGLSNNFDASSIKVTFGAPLNKSYTSTNITFSNNIFTLAIPSSDNISITNAGVDVMVNGKRTSTATSGQQFSLKIGGDGDASGTGVNSGLPVFSTGIVSGNKFTIDAVNTSILGALNAVVSNTEPAAGQFVAAGQRLLVGKIDLQTKKYITNNFADSVRIKSVTLTKPVAGGDVADADITKWELTDGSNTFTGSYTAAGKIKFDNMNYVVPPPSVDADSFTTQKTLSVYATVKDSVRNKTLSFSISVVGDIPSDGALYGNAATVTLGNNAANAQTLDAGKLVMTDDTTTNGVAPNNKGSASIGDVNVAVLGLNIINNQGSGAVATPTSPEDVYITQLKITNAGTGVLGTDIDSLKLYEKDVTETFIANASLMTDTATSQKYFQFSDSQLYKVVKNAAAKNLVIKANIPATASNGKTINLKMLSTDVTGKGFNSNVTLQAAAPSVANVTGKNIVIGTNSLTVTLDSLSPAASSFSIDEVEREVAVFSVKTGTGESITLDLSANSIEYSGNIPKADIASVKLKYNGTLYPLTITTLGGKEICTTATSVTIANNTTALFSILVKLKSEALLSGGFAANQYYEFKIGGATPSLLRGKSSITIADIDSTNGTPAPTSNKFTVVGKLALANDDSGNAPSGNVLIGDNNSGNGVDIFRFKITPSTENAKIDSIKFYLDKGSFTNDIDPTVANLKLKYNTTGNLFSAPADIINTAAATKTVSGNYVTFSGLSTIAPFNNLVKDTTYYFGFAGNIKSTSTSGTGISMKIESNSDISASGATSLKSITPSGSAAGNTLTTTSGGLSIEDAKTVDTKEVIINQEGAKLAAVVKLTASSTEKLAVKEIKINVEGDADFSTDFDSSTPYSFKVIEMKADNVTASGEVQMTSVTKNGNQITFNVNSTHATGSLFVNSGTSKNILIEATPKATATAGHKAKIIVESGWIKAVGAVSLKSITSTGSVNYSSGTMQEFINGLINSTVNSSSPSSKTVLKGQTLVELARFDIKSAKSANNAEIENIELTRVEVYLSSDTSNFTNTKIKIDGGADITRDASSTGNTHIFIPPAGAYILNKNGTAKVITVISDATSSASGKVYAKLVASGTKGKGDVSGKTIVCTSADQNGSEHSIGSSQMLLSSNITTGPSSEYLDVTNNPSGDKLVIGANLNVDDKESVTFNSGSRNIQMKLEGSVNKAAVTAVKIYAGSPGFATTWLNAANPFNNTTQTYNGDFTNNGVAVGPLTINSSTTEQFKLFVTLNQALVTDGDTLKITILNGGITGAGASSLQSVSSQNELSNTLTLQKTSAVISANTYSTGAYKRNDTGKTIIDFKMAAGKYQNLSIGKLYIKNQASGTKTSFDITNSTATTPEISNLKLYVDGVLYSGSPVAENKDKTGAADTGIIRIVLPTPIAISKGSSRSFKITADFTSKAQNGSNIKATSDYTYYSIADFTPNLYSSADLTGSASGNEHNIQVIETIDLTLDSTSPTSNNITITPIANGAAAGAFGHIATFKLRASEAATLTKAKFKYIGSNMSDISSFDAYLGTDSAAYAQGTQFTSSTIDSVNGKITFTHAGISINQNTDYYLKVGVKVPNSETLPTIGHSIKIQMDSSNPSDADYPPLVLSSPLTGSTASTVSSVVYNATASSNSIYIDSSEIYLKVESESLADITMQFASGGAVSNHKIMELTLSNTTYSDYTIEKFIFNVKQEGTQTSFESLTSTMSLGVFEGSEKIADASVDYDSSKLVGTFTISNFNSAYKTILKGQSKKLDIKFSSGSFTGATSPKVIFAIQSLTGSHTSGGSIVKGSQYTRIPIDTSKYFSWSASSSTVVEVGTSTPANAATDAAALITAAASSENLIISFKRSITLQAADLNFSGGLKTVRLNNYSLSTSLSGNTDITIATNTTFVNGSVNITSNDLNSITINATKTLTLGENCTFNNAGNINNIQGAIASNTQGTIINNNIINNAGAITNADGTTHSGLISNLGTITSTGTITNYLNPGPNGIIVNCGTLTNADATLGGTVKADGSNVTFNGAGATITNLTIDRPVSSLNISKTVTNLTVNANTTVSGGSALKIGTAATIASGVTFINNGSLDNSGATITNNGTLTHNNNAVIQGTVVAGGTGNVTFNGTSTGGIALLKIGSAVSSTIASINLNLKVTDLQDNGLAGCAVGTLTLGTNGSVTNTINTLTNVAFNNIDQSSVAADKTIALGTYAKPVSITGPPNNTLTLTTTADANAATITVKGGQVNLVGAGGAEDIINVAATSATKITATGKTISTLSGATTIDIAGANAVTVSGAVTTLTTSAAITTLNVNENITTLNVNTGGIGALQFTAGKTISSLNINANTALSANVANSKIGTLTFGASAATLTITPNGSNLTIDAIDQSAVAADKTFALGNMSTAITSVKAHATNSTTITGSALSGLTITQGVVNVSGATSSALNIAATAAATVNATSKTINNISGSAPIILNGAGAVTAATVTGATSDLTIAAGTTVTTLTINASQTLTKLTIDGTTNIASGANAVITTLTVGSAGTLNPLSIAGNLTITNIDQSAIAADRTIDLGSMTNAVSSVRGHSTNALTLTTTLGGTPTVNITAGTVNVVGCAGTLNVAATASTTVIAAGKDLASVSGPTTINIQGAANATITGAVTTLGVTAVITKLAVNAAVDTINVKANLTTLELDAALNTLAASGAAAAITTLTLKTSGSIANALATAGNLTITNIDQSAIASDKTIQLGNMTNASLVKGHATNSLTLSATGTPTITIDRGVVDVSNCAGTLNITATAATKVTATARTLAAVSGAQTIELAGAAVATISGAVTTLNVTGAVTTLNINADVTNSTIAFNSASTQTLAIGAAGILNQGGGTGLTVSNVTQGHKITIANGGKIYHDGGANGVYAVTLGTGTGKTITPATVTGIALAGTSPNATLAGTAAGAVTVNIAAGTGNITNP